MMDLAGAFSDVGSPSTPALGSPNVPDTGSCDFVEDYCWFRHCQSRPSQEPVSFKCKSCNKEFKFRFDSHLSDI